MSMQFNSGKVLAQVGSVSPNSVGNTATLSNAIANGTTTLGTCGAGKKWYIVSISLAFGNVAATNVDTYVQINGVKYLWIGEGAGAAAPGNNAIYAHWSLEACPIATAGQTIQLVSNGAVTNGGVVVTYVEVAV